MDFSKMTKKELMEFGAKAGTSYEDVYALLDYALAQKDYELINYMYTALQDDSCGLNPLQHWAWDADPAGLIEYLKVAVPDAIHNIMNNPGIDGPTLAKVASDPSTPWWTLEQIARHNNCPATTLAILAKHKKCDVRWGVASSANCDHDTYVLLSKDKRIEVKERLASNEKAPKDILLSLAKKSKPEEIFHALSNNWGAAEDVLKAVVQKDNDTRVKVARNPGITLKLARMTLDVDKTKVDWQTYEKFIKQNLVENKNCPAEILKEFLSTPYLAYFALQNPNMPVEILKVAAESSNVEVRRAVAWNPSCPKLSELVYDPDIEVRSYATRQIDNAVILTELAKSSDRRILESIICNPHTPNDVRKFVYGKLNTENRDYKDNKAKTEKSKDSFADAVQKILKKAATV